MTALTAAIVVRGRMAGMNRHGELAAILSRLDESIASMNSVSAETDNEEKYATEH
jgi:hypothetical protein